MMVRRDYFAEAKAEFDALAREAGAGRPPHPQATRQWACDIPNVPYSPFNAEQRSRAEFEALVAELGDLECEIGD